MASRSATRQSFTPFSPQSRAWRETEVFEQLEEEEQLHAIYSTTKNSHKTTEMAVEDDIETVSSRKLDAYWRQVRVYVLCKSVIWIMVGSVILIASLYKHNLLHKKKHGARNWCCDCFAYAEARQKEDTWFKQHRIDYSYCASYDCFDCTMCEQANASSILSSFVEYDEQCTRPIMRKRKDRPPEHCDLEVLSESTLKIFYKNYKAYGIGALAICIVYTLCHLWALCLSKSVHSVSTIGMLLTVYNVIVAMACLYMVFKIFQYQKMQIGRDDDGDSYDPEAFCYVDTTVEAAEDLLSVLVYSVFSLLLLQWLVFCCKCMTKNRRNKEMSCLISTIERFYIVTLIIGGILFFVTMTASLIVCIVHLVHQHNKESQTELWVLVCTFIVLSICSLDIFCCPFCRNRVRLFWMARRNRTRNMSATNKVLDYHQRGKYFDLMVRQSLLNAKVEEGDENVTFQAEDDDDKF